MDQRTNLRLEFPYGIPPEKRGQVTELLQSNGGSVEWEREDLAALINSHSTSEELMEQVELAGVDVREFFPEFELEIEGMMCQKNCGTTVTNLLIAIPEVKYAYASFEKSNAIVRGNIDPMKLVDAVESVGFGAKLKVRETQTESAKISIAQPGPAVGQLLSFEQVEEAPAQVVGLESGQVPTIDSRVEASPIDRVTKSESEKISIVQPGPAVGQLLSFDESEEAPAQVVGLQSSDQLPTIDTNGEAPLPKLNASPNEESAKTDADEPPPKPPKPQYLVPEDVDSEDTHLIPKDGREDESMIAPPPKPPKPQRHTQLELPPVERFRASSASDFVSIGSLSPRVKSSNSKGKSARVAPENSSSKDRAISEDSSFSAEDGLLGSRMSSPRNDPHDDRVELKIGGMSCAACVSNIEESLAVTRGIRSCKVALIAEKASVKFDPTQITAEAIAEQVTALGYPATIQSRGGDEFTAEVEIFFSQPFNQGDMDPVESQLENLPGVISVSPSEVDTRNTKIKYDPQEIGPRTILNVLKKAGYKDARLGSSASSFGKNNADDGGYRRSFIGSLFFTVPVVLVSMVLPMIPAFEKILTTGILPGLKIDALLLFLLTTPVQFGFGARFYRNAYKAVKNGAANMDLLVALGTTASYLYSFISVVLAMMFPDNEDWQEMEHDAHFFETSAMLITFVLLGKYLEATARSRTADAITALLRLQCPTALLIADKNSFPVSKQELAALKSSSVTKRTKALQEMEKRVGLEIKEMEEIDVRLMELGDILKVLPGGRIPCDGMVILGSTSVDESVLTGESMPVSKKAGDMVIGSTVNMNMGTLIIRVNKVGKDTTLNQIVSLVEQAQTSKAPIQAQADRIARWFVPIVVFLACLTWAVWFTVVFAWQTPPHYLKHSGLASEIVFAFKFGVAVLVISCPCALGLATPTAVMVATGVGANLGLLIKGGNALETGQNLTCVVFDKTGTLTHGRPTVADMITTRGSAKRMMMLCGSAELASEHPVARAIVQHCSNESQELTEPVQFESRAGMGIVCVVDSCDVAVGNRTLMEDLTLEIPKDLDAWCTERELQGMTVVLVASNKHLIGAVAVADTVKPTASLAVSALLSLGLDVWMVTGDVPNTAYAIARKCGLAECRVLAGVLPHQKSQKVLELQESGETVAFVGDGVNDAPALAQADLGIAIGAGTDVALEAADVVLIKSDPLDVATVVDLSIQALKRIRTNFFFSFVYNIVCIPIAAGALYPALMIRLPPALAGFMMAMSSVSVVLSSLTLRRYKKRDWVKEVRAGLKGEDQVQARRQARQGFNGDVTIPIKSCILTAGLSFFAMFILLLLVGLIGQPFASTEVMPMMGGSTMNRFPHSPMPRSMFYLERGKVEVLPDLGEHLMYLSLQVIPIPQPSSSASMPMMGGHETNVVPDVAPTYVKMMDLEELDVLLVNVDTSVVQVLTKRTADSSRMPRTSSSTMMKQEEDADHNTMMNGRRLRRQLRNRQPIKDVIPSNDNTISSGLKHPSEKSVVVVRWTRTDSRNGKRYEGMEVLATGFDLGGIPENQTCTPADASATMISSPMRNTTLAEATSCQGSVYYNEDTALSRIPFRMIFTHPELEHVVAFFIHESGAYAHRCECVVTERQRSRYGGTCSAMVNLELPGTYFAVTAQQLKGGTIAENLLSKVKVY